MGPGSRRASELVVADPAWRRFVPRTEAVVRRAALAAGTDATILLADDRTVRRLNARDRGKDKATNVLTYDPPAPGLPGQIVLALGVLRREAAAAHRRPAHHLAHLIVHAALHLAGEDHHQAGEARRMEMAEARILSGIGVPNPWKQGQGGSAPLDPPPGDKSPGPLGGFRAGGGRRGARAARADRVAESAVALSATRSARAARAPRLPPPARNQRMGSKGSALGGGPGGSAPWPCCPPIRAPRSPAA